MYRKLSVVSFTLFCIVFLAAQLPAQDAAPALKDPAAKDAAAHPEVVTNQTVIDMVNAKLPSDVIITKIQTAKTEFDLSTPALIKLNQSAVPSDVVKAMMQKSSAPASSAAAPAAEPPGDPNDPNVWHDPGIYVLASNGREKKLIMLEPTVYTQGHSGGHFASAMTYGIAKIKWKAVVRNAHANVKIGDPKAVFYFYFEEKGAGLSQQFGGTSTPNEFTLLKFDVKSDTRETTVMKANAFGSSTGTDDKANVGFKFDKLKPGIYMVTPTRDLAPGEYCFLSASMGGAYAPGAAAANRLFDFGVE